MGCPISEYTGTLSETCYVSGGRRGAGSVADIMAILSLWLVAAAYPGHTPNSLQTQQEAPAGFAEVGLPPMPEPQSSAIQIVALRSSTMLNDAESTSQHGQITRLEIAPQQSISDKSEPSLPSEEEANWVVVIRGATVHSGPSVSAPIVRFYSVGTELQLIDHQHGWFQVLDPATSQRGWIYEKYYLQAIRGPGHKIVALQEAVTPRQNVVSARRPTPNVRRVKKIGPRPAKKI